jgi:hypothetical protein
MKVSYTLKKDKKHRTINKVTRVSSFSLCIFVYSSDMRRPVTILHVDKMKTPVVVSED